MRKALPTLGVVSAGLLLAGSPAHAVGTSMSSTNNIGIANGIQASGAIQAPINVCGNGIGLLGTGSGTCVGGANANFATGRHGSGGGNVSMTTSGNTGLLNGIQAQGLLQIPINICGNGIGILGTGTGSCTGSGANANAFTGGQHHTSPPPMPYHPMIAPMAAGPVAHKALPTVHRKATPIRVHRKEAGLLANLLAPVTDLLGPHTGHSGYGSGGMCGNGSLSTANNIGVANGIQLQGNAQVPINFAGNGIGILGSGTGSSQGGANANFC